MLSDYHPTKSLLIKTVAEMLETIPPESLLSEDVMERTHVSKGSLYYHFETFQDLVEEALIYRFTMVSIEPLVRQLTGVIDKSSTAEEARVQFLQTLPYKDHEFPSRMKIDRIRALSRAMGSPKMSARLAMEQERINQLWDALFVKCAKRGWAAPGFAPREVSIMMQGLTMASVADQISLEHITAEQWNHLIDSFIGCTFFGAPALIVNQ